VIKLQSYLEIVSLILSQSQPSIDIMIFCLQLLFVLIKIGATEMEQEADIMWEVLEPNMMEGEIKFYLALLHSTLNDERLCELQVAKEADKNKAAVFLLPVMFPNEKTGRLTQQIVPLGLSRTVMDVKGVIGSRMREYDIQDYSMYCIGDTEVKFLEDYQSLEDIVQSEQDIRIALKRKDCSLLFPIFQK